MPKTVLDKVLHAIETLAEPGGASRPAIAKCVKSENGGVEVSAALLKKARPPVSPRASSSRQGRDLRWLEL